MYDPKPYHGIPVSAGIPPLIRWCGMVGFVVILIVVGIVVSASRYGHVWPSPDATHIQLSSGSNS